MTDPSSPAQPPVTNPMDAVRAALRSLADEGRPVDVATRALAGLRRRRRRQVAATGIGLVVLGVGGLVWPLWADDIRPPATPDGPTTLYYSDGVTVLAQLGPDPVGVDSPVGLVVGHVLDEVSHTDGSPLRGQSWESIRTGGYQITTTIDAHAQQILEAAADETVSGSLMDGQPSNLQAAGVVVEPGTGRVLAYYGGHDGFGNDYAGVHVTEDGAFMGFGAHPPGGTFMVYTLAAALKAGYSLNSYWQWTPHDQPGRPAANPVRNSSRCASNPDGETCSLLESVALSLNVPLYDVTVSVSPAAVLAMARDAGIDTIWNNDLTRLDLRAADPATLVNQGIEGIGVEVGIGQYAVTVLDQANTMATFAAGGLRAQVHFVRTVSYGGELVYGETLPTAGTPPVLAPAQLADLTYALTQVSGTADIAMKTGNWEYLQTGENAHAWSIGYTSALAAAIWIGNKAAEEPVMDKTGATIWGSTLPTQILRQVITETQQRLGLRPSPFPPPTFAGDVNPIGSVPS